MSLLSVCLSSCVALWPAQPVAATTPPVVVRASGIGRPPPGKSGAQARLLARRAAEVAALRNLLVRLQGWPARKPGRAAIAPAQGSLRGYRFLPPKYLPDGSVQVTVELPVFPATRIGSTTCPRGWGPC